MRTVLHNMLISGHVKRDCGQIRLHPRSKRLHSFRYFSKLAQTWSRQINVNFFTSSLGWKKQETFCCNHESCKRTETQHKISRRSGPGRRERTSFYKKSIRATKYAVINDESLEFLPIKIFTWWLLSWQQVDNYLPRSLQDIIIQATNLKKIAN